MNKRSYIFLLFTIFPILYSLIFIPSAFAQVNYSNYVWNEYTPKNPANVAADLKLKLETHINQMLIDQNNDGKHDHLAPLLVIMGAWRNTKFVLNQYEPSKGGRSEMTPFGVSWVDPGETIYALSLAYPYLSSALQSKVQAFIKSEMSGYQPFTFSVWGGGALSLPHMQGTRREYFDYPPNLTSVNIWPPIGPAVGTIYAYWVYAKNTGDTAVLSNNWTNMLNLYNKYKTGYSSGKKITYSEIGGLIGFARIAKQLGHSAESTDAANLAVQIMSNEGLNFNQMAQNINFEMQYQNQAEIWIWVEAALAHIQPEVGLYLKDNVQSAALTYINDLTSMRKLPLWYPAWAEGQGWGYNASNYSAVENPNYWPVTPYSIFLGKAYVQQDSEQNLRKYLDVPWSIGDLYYIQKLVATIEASSSTPPLPSPTSSASPTPSSTPSPTPNPLPGDIIVNGKVDIFDYNALLTDFGCSSGACLRSDIVVNNEVDIFDYNLLLTNFGKTYP